MKEVPIKEAAVVNPSWAGGVFFLVAGLVVVVMVIRRGYSVFWLALAAIFFGVAFCFGTTPTP